VELGGGRAGKRHNKESEGGGLIFRRNSVSIVCSGGRGKGRWFKKRRKTDHCCLFRGRGVGTEFSGCAPGVSLSPRCCWSRWEFHPWRGDELEKKGRPFKLKRLVALSALEIRESESPGEKGGERKVGLLMGS